MCIQLVLQEQNMDQSNGFVLRLNYLTFFGFVANQITSHQRHFYFFTKIKITFLFQPSQTSCIHLLTYCFGNCYPISHIQVNIICIDVGHGNTSKSAKTNEKQNCHLILKHLRLLFSILEAVLIYISRSLGL